MKVWFDGEQAQESYQFGPVLLQPGENDLDEAQAKALLAAKVVHKEKPIKKK